MIGITAGLVLLVASRYFFLGGRQVNRATGDLSRMQESGRTAMEIMGRAIRQAGSRSDSEISALSTGLHSPVPRWRGPRARGRPRHPHRSIRRAGRRRGQTASALMSPRVGGVTSAFAIDNASEPPASPATARRWSRNIEDMQIDLWRGHQQGRRHRAYQSWTGGQSGQVTAVRVSLLVRGPTAGLGGREPDVHLQRRLGVPSPTAILRQVYTSRSPCGPRRKADEHECQSPSPAPTHREQSKASCWSPG